MGDLVVGGEGREKHNTNQRHIMVGLTYTKSEEELEEDIVDLDDKEKELTLVNWSSLKEINDKKEPRG